MAILLVLTSMVAVASGIFSDDGNGVLHVKTLSGDVYKADFAQAIFGPDVPTDDGFQGHIYVTDPPDACTKLTVISSSSMLDISGPIALIARKGRRCSFIVKVLNAQEAGYKAVVVYDDDPQEAIFSMASDNGTLTRKVNISSVFISNADGIVINNTYSCQPFQPCRYFVRLQLVTNFLDPSSILIPMAIAFACILFIAVTVVVVRWVKEYRRRLKSRVSKSQLKKIPSRKFRKGDAYDACAICLDDYNEGDKIRILPCSHAYHVKCIDPWLLNNKRTCPVCKRTAVPGGPGSEDSDAENDDRNGRGATERTPLLPPPAGGAAAAESLPNASSAAAPNNQASASRFYGSGLPVVFENEVMLDSSDDECSTGNTSLGENDVCLALSSRPSSRTTGQGLPCEFSVGSVSINGDPVGAGSGPTDVTGTCNPADCSNEQVCNRGTVDI